MEGQNQFLEVRDGPFEAYLYFVCLCPAAWGLGVGIALLIRWVA
jgi:hypothetical protein